MHYNIIEDDKEEDKTHRKGLITVTKRELMKEAHRIAKEELEGDYQAKLSLALKMVWRKQKEGNELKTVKVNFKSTEESFVKVNGEVICKDARIATNISSRAGFSREERVSKEHPWTATYEVTEKRFKEVTSQFEKIEMYQEALKEAKQTGEKAKYYAYTEECRSKNEQCDIDKVFLYVNPEGEVERERVHTH